MPGVTPLGFERKSLAEILADVEAAASGAFGPALIQTAESPQGQLNGIFANIAAQTWEMAEDVYQSLDPDQAEGPRLDMLARLRGLVRPAGEDDATFARRITNRDRPDIHLRPAIEAVEAVAGVGCVRVWVNDTGTVDANGIPGHSICFAVTGGDDAEVGAAIHDWTVAGIGLYGNTTVTVPDASGICRTLAFLRPAPRPVSLNVTIASRPPDGRGCAAPTVDEVRDAIVAGLSCAAAGGLGNGADVTESRVRQALSVLPGAEVLTVAGRAG